MSRAVPQSWSSRFRGRPTAAAAGELMDEAARRTPDGWDFSLQWSANDDTQRAEWVAMWIPTFRTHLRGDEALDATVIGRGSTAPEALTVLLDGEYRLPRGFALKGKP